MPVPANGSASAELDAAGYSQQLDRRLKLRHLLVYGMVFIVPIAPVAVYGFVAHASQGMVPLVYLVGMVAMFFTALSYKQLSAEFPFAGSVYAYVRRGINPFLGFIAGWMILADYLGTGGDLHLRVELDRRSGAGRAALDMDCGAADDQHRDQRAGRSPAVARAFRAAGARTGRA